MKSFGRVILTGSAAKAFREQFLENPKPNLLAKSALKDGLKILQEMQEKGYITSL